MARSSGHDEDSNSARSAWSTPRADVVYRCIADYRRHHRPEGFLPPAFSDLRVERGGVGAGTAISFTMTVAGEGPGRPPRSPSRPCRVLVETGPSVRTVFTVQPEGTRSRVRFDTVIEAGGLEGLLTRLFAARLLGPLYRDELERLERYAQANAERIRAELNAPARAFGRNRAGSANMRYGTAAMASSQSSVAV